MVVMLLLLGGY